MAYVHTRGVDPTKPAGTDPANVDDDMRDIKLAYNERFDDFFGTDWANDDPIEPTKIGPNITVAGGQVFTNIYNAGNSGASLTLDFDNGDQQTFSLTANCTLAFSNIRAGSSYVLYVYQGGAGNFSLTFPSTVRASNNLNFTANVVAAAGRLAIISLTAFSSTRLFGSLVGANINAS